MTDRQDRPDYDDLPPLRQYDEDDLADGPHLAVFKYRLPVALPLSEDNFHVFDLGTTYAGDDPRGADFDVPPFVRLRFIHMVATEEGRPLPWRPGLFEALPYVIGGTHEPLPDDLVPPVVDPPDGYEWMQTWVEAASPAAMLAGEDPDMGIFTSAFERTVVCVNRLIRAFNVVADYHRVYPVNKEVLDPIAFMSVEDCTTGNSEFWGMFMLHKNLLDGPVRLLADDEEKDVWHLMDASARGHPFMRHREWLDRAGDARFRRGDYEESLWCLQVSVENLLAGIVYSTAVDQGLRKSEVEARTAEWTQPFSALVRAHLPALLGGNWDPDNDRTPVGRYWHDLYLARNRTSHAGHTTSFTDIDRAFAAFDGLVDHVHARVLAQPKKYPRTLLALLGRPALERRNAWNRTIREFAATLADEPYPYWQPWDQVGRPNPDT